MLVKSHLFLLNAVLITNLSVFQKAFSLIFKFLITFPAISIQTVPIVMTYLFNAVSITTKIDFYCPNLFFQVNKIHSSSKSALVVI
jgi:hypothetical protein